MAFTNQSSLDVVYDNKAYGNVIDPAQWNDNFKKIEEIANGNVVKVDGNFDALESVADGSSGADQIGSTALKSGGATTVQTQLEELKTDTTESLLAHTARVDNPHVVTKTQLGLNNVTNDEQATKVEYNAHIARVDNPHVVTASQVGAYSKTEMQTSGQSALHWGNLTNVPNMADASWKSAVATPANLPITGNAVKDQRIVLNDGDGKQAMYSCVAIAGDWDAQWDKIADVDFAGDEATRVTQENARVSAETSRVTAEGDRATADSDRTTVEGGRVSAESGRTSAESTRVTQENTRLSQESARQTNESNRGVAETARVNAEGLRVTADGNRTVAENARSVAETNRVNAESSRVTADNARVYIGAYDNATAYVVGNQVTYLGSTYRNILNSTGKLPTNETYWILTASKGADGIGSGDMLKATYDTTNNGTVDNAELVNGLAVLKAVPADALFTDTIYTHPTTTGNKHIPSGGSANQVLKYSADGTAVWGTDSDTITTINGKTGAIAKADITALGIPAQDTVTTIANNLTETVTGKALDATQGKVLADKISTNTAGIHGNEINVAKLGFAVQSSLQAGLNNLSNMAIDGFTDATGINASLSSGYIYDVTNKLFKPSVNYDVKYEADALPASSSPAWAKVVIGTGQSESVASGLLYMKAGTPDGCSLLYTITNTALASKTKYVKGKAKIVVGATSTANGAGLEIGVHDGTRGARIVFGATTIQYLNGSSAWTNLATGLNFTSNYFDFEISFNNTSGVVLIVNGTTYTLPYTSIVTTSQREICFTVDHQASLRSEAYVDYLYYSLDDTSLSVANMTLVSNNITALTSPSQGYILADKSIPSGGGVVFYISKDGGTNWAVVTEEQLTNFTAGTGTTICVKAVTSGNVDNQLKSWAFGWR